MDTRQLVGGWRVIMALVAAIGTILAGNFRATLTGAADEEDARTPRLVVQTGHAAYITSVAFVPTATPSSPDLGTGRRGCGMRRAAARSDDSRDTGAMSPAWRSRPTATPSSPGPARRRGCGMRRAAARSDASKDTRERSRAWRSRPTAAPSSPVWDKTARLWDAASGREIRRLEGHSGWVSSVAFAPTAAPSSPDPGTRRRGSGTWPPAARSEHSTSRTRSRAWRSAPTAAPSSPDPLTGRRALGRGHRPRDPNTLPRVRDLERGIRPDGRTVLTGSLDKAARLWDAASGKVIRRLEGHTGRVCSVAFAADGRTILTGSWDKTARLWDAASGKEIRRLEGHGSWVSSVAFVPDGRTIFTGFEDTPARLWDVASGKGTQPFEGGGGWVSSVAFAPTAAPSSPGPAIRRGCGTIRRGSGTRRAAARSDDSKATRAGSVAWRSRPTAAPSSPVLDNTARLWDAASGKEIRRLKGHTSLVESVAFAPTAAPSSPGPWDKTARLWDVASGREIRRLEGHSGWVSSVAFAPDGRTILTGSRDGTVRLWDAASGKEIRRLEGHGYGSRAWRSRPTAAPSSPDPWTRRCGCGTRRAAKRSDDSRDTGTGS